MTVQERKTFFIKKDMSDADNAGGKFHAYINVPFAADELRIVQLLYVADTAVNDQILSLLWHGVGYVCMFDVKDHTTSNVNIRINVHGKEFQGNQEFQLVDTAGAPFAAADGKLGITFEAIKY